MELRWHESNDPILGITTLTGKRCVPCSVILTGYWKAGHTRLGVLELLPADAEVVSCNGAVRLRSKGQKEW
jgi:hypothetical protein